MNSARQNISADSYMASESERIRLARQVLRSEGLAICALAERLEDADFSDAFTRAAKAIYECPGKVVLTGIGKAGIIARKISGTLASTGTQSIFLHPVEALHGDLGRLVQEDVVVALSHSGSTEELIRLVDHIKARGAKLVAITAETKSPLALHADIALGYGQVEEACPHGLAPTVSTSCMLALGDALALTVMSMRNFGPEQFATHHPAGTLGRKLLKVEEVMTFRGGDRLAVAQDTLTLAEALVEGEKVLRRSGALLMVDGSGRLTGILTDADLRRVLLKHRQTNILDRPVSEFMTRNPKRIRRGQLASEALAVLNRHRIDELPVVDRQDRPVGIIDVQDLIGVKTVSDDES